MHAQAGTCAGMSLGANTSLNGFVPFPASDPWRQDISNALVDPNSDAILSTIGAGTKVHPDFGAGIYNGSYVGIPYQVVSNQKPVEIFFKAYKSESDPIFMPIPATAQVEGQPNIPAGSDEHVLTLDRDHCMLYELFGGVVKKNGEWEAQSGVVWDLLNNNQRPYTWGSTDAAGLPIFPGLARYDEVSAGVINHALRFTLGTSLAAFLPPATHWAASNAKEYSPAMGMRMRLRANFDISGFSPQAKIILTALKKYGMILADNGSSMYLSGAPNDGWNNDDLHNLGKVTAADFEVLQEKPEYTASDLPTGALPTITHFTASATTVKKGQSITLSWSGTGASSYMISPVPGPVRGNSVTVTPTGYTTYRLYATNQFGRVHAYVTINVD